MVSVNTNVFTRVCIELHYMLVKRHQQYTHPYTVLEYVYFFHKLCNKSLITSPKTDNEFKRGIILCQFVALFIAYIHVVSKLSK